MPTSSASLGRESGRPTPVLEADRVTAGYGGVPVVREVSVRVGAGETVAVIEPNGAGKSTFLKALVGILRVTDGRVLLGDSEVTNHSPEQLAARDVASAPQV